jgi:acyl-CoA synthetase (AMP-forming)/AMP-acid ligase II
MRYLLHHLLESSAKRYPDRIAIVDRDRTFTYAELDRRANQLAHALLDLGVGQGDRVGLYLDKSLESLVGIYGVLKAGAAYVPFDPNAPTARLGYIAGNCGIRVLLTGREKSSRWSELVANGARLDTLVVLNQNAGTPGSNGMRIVTADEVARRPDSAVSRKA